MNYKIVQTSPPVCQFHPFGKEAMMVVTLTAWPPLWARFWMRVFFGWKFEPL